MTTMRTHNVYVMALLLLTLCCGSLLQVGTAQARALTGQQKAIDCQAPRVTGWRPYRTQRSDSLTTLAAQGNVSVAELMKVNCLTTAVVSADTLLLVPSPAVPRQNGVLAAPIPVAEQNQSSSALLTVISTTTNLAASTTSVVVTASQSAKPTAPWAWVLLIGVGLVSIATGGMGGRAAQGSPQPAYRWFGLWSNLLCLGLGLFVGMVFFPELRMPALTTLPTSISTAVTVALIGLLAAKELFFKGQQWRTLNRVLNVGMVPLLALFFLTVATRVAETIR